MRLDNSINAVADQFLVARAERGQTIAHHDPVGQPAVDQPALAARLAHHLGVVAFAGDAEIGRIEGGEHVEIEEAVVERRDQRVGHRMGEPHQIGVVAGRIDHHHVVAVLERADRLREVGEFLRLVGFQRIALGPLHAVMRRQVKRDARAFGPGAAVLDVMGETFLPAVEIDGRHALAGLEQRDRNMQSGGGLARAAFLVAENDHVSGLTSLLDRLDQHDAPPRIRNSRIITALSSSSL